MSLLWGDNGQSKFEQKDKLLHTNDSLESAREEAALVEIEMYENAIKQLYQMLTIACQERDEARIQLQRSVDEISELKRFLHNRFLPSNNTPVFSHVLQPAAGSLIPSKITDVNASDYISETFSNHSPFSSQVDGISFAVSSPGFSNLSVSSNSGLIQQQPFLQMGSNHAMFDCASMVIDNLVKGKSLPEKGKLLQAVMDAGPLLEALLFTGPLPKWRNPPYQRAVVDSNCANIPTSLLNVAQYSSMPCLSSMGSMHHQSLTGKRKRFQ